MNIQPTGATLPPQGNPVTNGAVRAVKSDGDVKINASEASSSASQVTPPEQPARDKLEAATKSVRQFVETINSNLDFSVDHDTGQLVVKIIDRATKEVIRQIPSEEMLSIAKALDSIKGLFVKQTA